MINHIFILFLDKMFDNAKYSTQKSFHHAFLNIASWRNVSWVVSINSRFQTNGTIIVYIALIVELV